MSDNLGGRISLSYNFLDLLPHTVKALGLSLSPVVHVNVHTVPTNLFNTQRVGEVRDNGVWDHTSYLLYVAGSDLTGWCRRHGEA